jgi:ankyrin repeat protein
VRIPNELKLMLADRLDLADVSTLVRTTRALNLLLAQYIYRRAKDLRSRNQYGKPYFLRAVAANNLTAVKDFIEVGASVDMRDPTDNFLPTALHRCVWEGYIGMAQLLIQHGVNMSPVSCRGETPLHRAIGWDLEETWVRLLVDAGADILASSANDETILSRATTCGELSTLQFLLERGAIPTTRNKDGDTLLHCPVKGGSAATIGLLLEAGLNIEATNSSGETPLHHAALWGRSDYVFEFLQRGANVDAIDIDGLTPLQVCLRWTPTISADRHILHHETLPKECAPKGSQTCVPGCRFAEFGTSVVDLLLSAGADIRASRNSTRSPLDWARRNDSL